MNLTSGKPSLLVTLGELDVEVGDQGVDVIVALDLQTEGWGEGQVLCLHSVDVYFLRKKKNSVHFFCTCKLSPVTHMSILLDYSPWSFVHVSVCVWKPTGWITAGKRSLLTLHMLCGCPPSSLRGREGGREAVCVCAILDYSHCRDINLFPVTPWHKSFMFRGGGR